MQRQESTGINDRRKNRVNDCYKKHFEKSSSWVLFAGQVRKRVSEAQQSIYLAHLNLQFARPVLFKVTRVVYRDLC